MAGKPRVTAPASGRPEVNRAAVSGGGDCGKAYRRQHLSKQERQQAVEAFRSGGNVESSATWDLISAGLQSAGLRGLHPAAADKIPARSTSSRLCAVCGINRTSGRSSSTTWGNVHQFRVAGRRSKMDIGSKTASKREETGGERAAVPELRSHLIDRPRGGQTFCLPSLRRGE